MRKQKKRPPRLKPWTQRTRSLSGVRAMRTKIFDMKRKVDSLDIDLEILGMINTRNKEVVQNKRLQATNLNHHLRKIENRISALSKEQRKRLAELSKASSQARKAFKMKIMKRLKNKRQQKIKVDRKLEVDKLRRKVSRVREDNRVSLQRSKKLRIERNRNIKYKQKLGLLKMMKQRYSEADTSYKKNSVQYKRLRRKLGLEMRNYSVKVSKKKMKMRRGNRLKEDKHQNKKRCSSMQRKLLKKMVELEKAEDSILEVDDLTRQYQLLFRSLVGRRHLGRKSRVPHKSHSVNLGSFDDNERSLQSMRSAPRPRINRNKRKLRQNYLMRTDQSGIGRTLDIKEDSSKKMKTRGNFLMLTAPDLDDEQDVRRRRRNRAKRNLEMQSVSISKPSDIDITLDDNYPRNASENGGSSVRVLNTKEIDGGVVGSKTQDFSKDLGKIYGGEEKDEQIMVEVNLKGVKVGDPKEGVVEGEENKQVQESES